MRKHSLRNTNINNPLGDYPERFLRQLESQFYALATLREYGRCLRALAAHMRESILR